MEAVGIDEEDEAEMQPRIRERVNSSSFGVIMVAQLSTLLLRYPASKKYECRADFRA